MPDVQIIKATKSRKAMMEEKTRRLRVAAYARVSTEKDEQENSYEGQVNYYTRYIQDHPTWVFVKVYADQGVSGTSTKHRKGFQEMMSDAEEGKIDLILVKSISRFGRNTVDIVDACRVLKANNVDVIFEKENLQLFSTSGEFMLTLFSSFAQEESRSISENITWTVRNNYKEGKYHMAYSRFLGYEKGPDGKPKIVEKEAAVVRDIYQLFIEGKSPSMIAKVLTERGIKSPGGKEKWTCSTVKSILTNEKYAGDAVLQKTFVADFLNHRTVKNEGQLDQYYLRDDHEGIVSHEIFDYVQAELERRKGSRTSSAEGLFAGKLFCGECGKLYGQKVWHSNEKYRKEIYRCNDKYEGKKVCKTPTVTDEIVKKAFMSVMRDLISEEDLFENLDLVLKTVSDTSELESKLEDARLELELCNDKISQLSMHSDTAEFNSKYEKLTAKLEKAEKEAYQYSTAIDKKLKSASTIRLYIESLREVKDSLGEFDERTFNILLERVTVNTDNFVFRFRDGREVTYSFALQPGGL